MKPARMMAWFVVTASLVAAALPASAALTVAVNPASALVTLHETSAFTVKVHDQNGREVEATVNWEVVPARLGTIDADGRFVASGIGRGLVRVSVSASGETATGHAMVTVTPLHQPPAATLVLDPASAQLSPGASLQFHLLQGGPGAAAQDAHVAEWRVIPETLGSIDANGLFTASGNAGAGHVVARLSSDPRVIAEARVVIGSPASGETRVELEPARVLMRPGETRNFRALVTPAAKGTGAPTAVVWSLIPSDLGTIAADGTLTAGLNATDGRVVATVATTNGVSRGYANVAVRAAGDRSLAVQLRPAEAVVAPGGDMHFTAIVLGAEGEIRDAHVEWEVQPSSIGTISPDGVFTASPVTTAARSGQVIARTREGSTIAVAAARLVLAERTPNLALQVRPSRATLAPGEQLQFTADLGAELGAANATPVSILWSVSAPEVASITPDGLFTASRVTANVGNPGLTERNVIVTAEATLADGQVLHGIASVLIAKPGPSDRINLVPDAVQLKPGQSVTFHLYISGIESDHLGAPVQWKSYPPALGTMDERTGVFTASSEPGAPLAGTVSASIEAVQPGGRTLRATARVRIMMNSAAPNTNHGN